MMDGQITIVINQLRQKSKEVKSQTQKGLTIPWQSNVFFQYANTRCKYFVFNNLGQIKYNEKWAKTIVINKVSYKF